MLQGYSDLWEFIENLSEGEVIGVPMGFKGLRTIQKVMLLQIIGLWSIVVTGNPTSGASGGGSLNQCPWDSTCKLIQECDSGYYMTPDMQAFHCGPIRESESMVCCFNQALLQESQGEANNNETGLGELETPSTGVDKDDEIKPDNKDIVPELNDVEMNILKGGEDHRVHHVQSHEDAVGHGEVKQSRTYAQDIHGNPLPLPDLPQDGYQDNLRNAHNAQRHETGFESTSRAAVNRNPNDPLESEIFEDFHRQESYRRKPTHPDQFQHFESHNAYQREPRDPQELNYRIRGEKMEDFHQQNYLNDWRQDRFPPKREHWQEAHQVPYKECPCEKGERGPPGPKGEPGEPGKIIYIPVFVSPNGHPVNQDNIGNALPSHYPPGNGKLPLHQPNNLFGKEFPNEQAYQYSFSSHSQEAPPHVTHPSPTFVNYAVPLPPSMPPSQPGSSYPPTYRQAQHPHNFPQGNPSNSPFNSGHLYTIPLTTVRQKRFEMH